MSDRRNAVMTKLLWTYVVAMMALSCASSSPPGFDTGTEGGVGGGMDPMPTSSSSGAATGGSGSGGIQGGSGSGGSIGAADGAPVFSDAGAGMLFDAAAPSDADVGQTVTLTADTFTVDVGAEVFKCQTFPNPFGKDVDLIYLDGTMSAGSHHFFLFNLDPTTVALRLETPPTPLKDCPGGGIEFHPFPYLSQQPHWIVNFPQPNMGYPLSAQNSLMINVHYLNATTAPIQASAKITIMAAKPGVVTTHIGTIFLNNTLFSVPPTPATSPAPYTKTWTPASGQLPANYNIFTSWSHMHRTSVDFQASANGSVFYDEKNWDSPPLYVHSPAMPMSGTAPITWSCSYYNDTSSTLTFGESAKNNVMCIYMGQYYPVVDPKNPDLIQVLQ
jgi:hypothetical protein